MELIPFVEPPLLLCVDYGTNWQRSEVVYLQNVTDIGLHSLEENGNLTPLNRDQNIQMRNKQVGLLFHLTLTPKIHTTIFTDLETGYLEARETYQDPCCDERRYKILPARLSFSTDELKILRKVATCKPQDKYYVNRYY